MGSRTACQVIGILAGFLLSCSAPMVAHAQDNGSTDVISDFSPLDISSESLDMAIVRKRSSKPRLTEILRHAGREWPRLLLRYAQPAVRGLLTDSYPGNSTLAFKTTLFRDNTKGIHLAGGVGRNSWGEREARLQFNLRF